MAADWWGGEHAYGIACRTGEVLDAVEVPSWLGPYVLPAVEHYGFVAEVSRPLSTTWLFFVTPGSPRIPDLPRVASLRLHTAGAWVLLPPTPTIGGSTRWVVRHPEFRLPHSLCLQWAVVRGVTAARHARRAAREGGRAGHAGGIPPTSADTS
jgi:hypothetical protein